MSKDDPKLAPAPELDPIAMLEALTLEKIDESINKLQLEITEFVAPREKRMDALKAIRRMINIRENGMPQKKPRGRPKQQLAPTPKSANFAAGLPDPGKVKTFLSVNGPTRVELIAAEFKVPVNDDLREMLDDERFFVSDRGGRIAARSKA